MHAAQARNYTTFKTKQKALSHRKKASTGVHRLCRGRWLHPQLWRSSGSVAAGGGARACGRHFTISLSHDFGQKARPRWQHEPGGEQALRPIEILSASALGHEAPNLAVYSLLFSDCFAFHFPSVLSVCGCVRALLLLLLSMVRW